MALAQRADPSHGVMDSYTATMPQIQDLDVQAIWDGVSQHPAHVKIRFKINSQSGSRVAILECDSERVAVTSVVTTQQIEPGHVGSESETLRQYSGEFSGDTLTVANAGLSLRESFVLTPSMGVTTKERKRRLFPHPREIFDGPLWAEDLPLFVGQTSRSALGVGGHQLSETKNSDFVHLMPCHPPIGALDGDRSTSADTVEIHLLSRPTPPFCENDIGSLDLSEQDSLEIPADKASKVPEVLESGSPRKLGVTKRAKRSKRQTQKNQTPWQSPNRVGFSLKSKASTVVQPSHESPLTHGDSTPVSRLSKLSIARESTLRKSSSKSAEPMRKTSGNCLGAGTPGKPSTFKQTACTLGRVGGNTLHNREEDAARHAKPSLGVPRATKSILDQSVQSLDTERSGQAWSNIFEDLQDKRPPPSTTPTRIPTDLAVPFGDHQRSQQTSPRTRVRTPGTSKSYITHSPGQKLDLEGSPMWAVEGGELVISFPEAVPIKSFGVDIEAEVHLVKVGNDNWQTFSISICSQLDPGNVVGSFSFMLEPASGQDETPDAQFRTESVFEDHSIAAKQIAGMFWVAEPLHIALRFRMPMLKIPFYTMGAGLCAVPVWSEEKGIQVKYNARLNIEIPHYDVFADQICLSLITENGPHCTDTYYLDQGETSVLLRDVHPLLASPIPNLTETNIVIIRDAADIGSPLELCFIMSYGRSSPITIPLPHIRPAEGKVLTESIFFKQPPPGLTIEHQPASPFSTWKVMEAVDDGIRIYRFDRISIPLTFPEGLKDDVMVKITQQAPVHFKALEEPDYPIANVNPENVIQNLKLKVAQILGGKLECRMTLDIQATNSCRLLTIDHHDWYPKLSLIDGQLATEDVGQWRETDDSNSTLFKAGRMQDGQTITVEFHWEEWDILDEFKGDGYRGFIVYDLPRVIGKTVLGGSLQCDANGGIVTLDDGVGETVYRCFDRSGRDRVMLPTLRRGYKMELGFHRNRQNTEHLLTSGEHDLRCQTTAPRVLFAGGIPLSSRQIRFADELSGGSSDAFYGASPIIMDDSDADSVFSSEFEENPLPALTRPPDMEQLVDFWLRFPFRMTRLVIGRIIYLGRHWHYLLGLGIILLRFMIPGSDTAASALNHVQQSKADNGQLALSTFPHPMDGAILAAQIPQQRTASKEEAIATIQEWVLSTVPDGGPDGHTSSAEDSGDIKFDHYARPKGIDAGSGGNQGHDVGHIRTEKSLRDWVDYLLGWKGEA